MFLSLLVAFWFGGMVNACGHIAVEFRRGVDAQTAFVAHNHPFVYSICLLAGVIAWPVMQLIVWQRSGSHRASDDDDDDDDDDWGDPEPEAA